VRRGGKGSELIQPSGVSLNSVKDWLSCDIVSFKIKVGLDAKCAVKKHAKWPL